MKDVLSGEGSESSSFDSYFRDPSAADVHALAWTLGQRAESIDALRGLFSGSQNLVRLRLWCFLELAAQPQARLVREDLNQLFHQLVPEALDAVLKRLRDLNLLVWDATAQDYRLSALAQQVQGLLAPLAKAPSDDDEMSALLSQLAGAHALGLADPQQIKHLHAQLSRLRDEFADDIASGSEARLRSAQPRFARALQLVERAGQALTTLIRAEHDDPRLEREARALGQGQARLLSMASQFTRALQQADRQRLTLGSTGLTTSDVRQWLLGHPALHTLLGDALSTGVRPVLISPHDMIDVAEGEFERDRPDPGRSMVLPPPTEASHGILQTLGMPAELGALIELLKGWQPAPPSGGVDADEAARHPVSAAVLGGRFAQAAYRMQLLPLLGDEQARGLKGMTGDLARQPWQLVLSPQVSPVNDEQVAAISDGHLVCENDSTT